MGDIDSGGFDIEAKRKELMQLWEDSFELCQMFVTQAREGKLKLTGSVLKELNSFLRASSDILNGFAEEAEAREMAERRRQELSGERDPLDHLLDGLTEEDLAVPETYRE